MAIKGKTRRRGRPKGVHAPSKPLAQPRKLPLAARPRVRRGLAVVLGLLVVLGGLRVWQNDVRTGALKDYVSELRNALGSYTQHLGVESATAIDTRVREFTQAKMSNEQFRELAGIWEKDLRTARDKVRALEPPRQMRAVEQWLLGGLDGFIGAVRLFNVAAQQRTFADAPEQREVQQGLENQVQVVIQHANEALTRSRAQFQRGINILDAFIKSWHVSDEPFSPRPPVPEVPN